MIKQADRELKQRWLQRFTELPPEARDALRDALLDLRADAAVRAEHAWRKRKAPMARYHRVLSVYAGHIARALKASGETSAGVTQDETRGPLARQVLREARLRRNGASRR